MSRSSAIVSAGTLLARSHCAARARMRGNSNRNAFFSLSGENSPLEEVGTRCCNTTPFASPEMMTTTLYDSTRCRRDLQSGASESMNGAAPFCRPRNFFGTGFVDLDVSQYDDAVMSA